MKSYLVFLLSLFPLLLAHAESPVLEDTSALFVDEELFVLDEKWGEELIDLGQELSLSEEANQDKPIDCPSAAQNTTTQIAIDVAKPLDTPLDSFYDEIVREEKPALAEKITQHPYSAYESQEELATKHRQSRTVDVELDLQRAFSSSPVIYTLLCTMSVFAVFIWVYSLLSLKRMSKTPPTIVGNLQASLNANHFDQALSVCRAHDTLLCKMVASGIQSRKYGASAMIESMKAEGKRSTIGFWQKLGLLNDIAIVAPMLGLLGTVLGMFYAFYDVNRSIESVTSLFDGLGVSVGTTVAGLIVAILALILHSSAKYRLIRLLSQVESDAHHTTSLIDNYTSLYTSESK